MKALSYPGMPTHGIPTVAPVPTPTPAPVSMPFLNDHLALILGGFRGRVHARVDARKAAYPVQTEDEWCEEFYEAVGDVLATDDGPARGRALDDLGALIAEWRVAIDRAAHLPEGAQA